jgi:ribosomal protein L11 methyltransferase
VKEWPALDVRGSEPDRILAAVDDFSPTAAEERGDTLRIFFGSATARDAAAAALGADALSVDVDDEDWASRSQANLAPITVGNITVFPGPVSPHSDLVPTPSPRRPSISIVIRPSMGFGTGHHETTRLCLAALQRVDLNGQFVLDVGTGSGILGIASSRLGARRVLGIDDDRDAIESAVENLGLNPLARNVTLTVADLSAMTLPPAGVVVANLTGALLCRAAKALLGAVTPSGRLILSGFLDHEEAAVAHAFGGAAIQGRDQEAEWICLTLNHGVSFPV